MNARTASGIRPNWVSLKGHTCGKNKSARSSSCAPNVEHRIDSSGQEISTFSSAPGTLVRLISLHWWREFQDPAPRACFGTPVAVPPGQSRRPCTADTGSRRARRSAHEASATGATRREENRRAACAALARLGLPLHRLFLQVVKLFPQLLPLPLQPPDLSVGGLARVRGVADLPLGLGRFLAEALRVPFDCDARLRLLAAEEGERSREERPGRKAVLLLRLVDALELPGEAWATLEREKRAG